MKQFDLVEALTGKPVCDRNGNEVKNFRVRTTDDEYCAGSFSEYPFVGEDVDHVLRAYTSNGVYDLIGDQPEQDLFMMYEQSDYMRFLTLLKERLQKLEDQLGLKDEEEIDPYKELKDAIAQGKVVQFRYDNTGEWMSPEQVGAQGWSLNAPVDWYRIKPETMRYRVYEWKTTWSDKNRLSVVEDEIQESAVSSAPNFVKWVSDWVEVEL